METVIRVQEYPGLIASKSSDIEFIKSFLRPRYNYKFTEIVFCESRPWKDVYLLSDNRTITVYKKREFTMYLINMRTSEHFERTLIGFDFDFMELVNFDLRRVGVRIEEFQQPIDEIIYGAGGDICQWRILIFSNV